MDMVLTPLLYITGYMLAGQTDVALRSDSSAISFLNCKSFQTQQLHDVGHIRACEAE